MNPYRLVELFPSADFSEAAFADAVDLLGEPCLVILAAETELLDIALLMEEGKGPLTVVPVLDWPGGRWMAIGKSSIVWSREF